MVGPEKENDAPRDAPTFSSTDGAASIGGSADDELEESCAASKEASGRVVTEAAGASRASSPPSPSGTFAGATDPRSSSREELS